MPDPTRRALLKAAFVAPAIATFPAIASFAGAGSGDATETPGSTPGVLGAPSGPFYHDGDSITVGGQTYVHQGGRWVYVP
jgi:hypothetical protein